MLKSLAKEPGQRFQTADHFLRALAGSDRVWQQEADETKPLEGESEQLGEVIEDCSNPTRLAQAVWERDLSDREATAIDLAPYSPLSSTSAEALAADLTSEANRRLQEFEGIWDQLVASARHE